MNLLMETVYAQNFKVSKNDEVISERKSKETKKA